MLRLLSPAEILVYVTFTNYLAVLGGVALWAALFVLGLIARRLERAFEVPTHWRLLLWAPSGILLYTVYVLVAAGGGGDSSGGTALERRVAYGALLISAVLSLWGCGRTMLLLLRLERSRERTAA